MRVRQLQKRDENIAKASDLLRRMREQEKENFDSLHNIKDKEIVIDDLILLHDTQHENDKSFNRKLNYR